MLALLPVVVSLVIRATSVHGVEGIEGNDVATPVSDQTVEEFESRRSNGDTDTWDEESRETGNEENVLDERRDQRLDPWFPLITADKIESSEPGTIQRPKKSPFNSWGGKRMATFYNGNWPIRRPIRVPFNSWGGKRAESRIAEDSKRSYGTPFYNWGGKRSQAEKFAVIIESTGTDLGSVKRTGNDYATDNKAEGGKWQISSDKRLERVQPRRTSFNPWGGKRSPAALRQPDDYTPKGRRVFFPWGG